MDWPSHFDKPQKCLPKFYIWFWRYLEKKICILPDLSRFLPHWQTWFIASVGRDFIQWRILYVTHPKPYEVLGDLFVVNIFVIKQNILITFSPLLRIVSSSEKGTSKFICKFAKEILWVFGLILRKLCSKSKWTFSYAALRNLAYWRQKIMWIFSKKEPLISNCRVLLS